MYSRKSNKSKKNSIKGETFVGAFAKPFDDKGDAESLETRLVESLAPGIIICKSVVSWSSL